MSAAMAKIFRKVDSQNDIEGVRNLEMQPQSERHGIVNGRADGRPRSHLHAFVFIHPVIRCWVRE
jgi:hypothetical protein